LGVSAALLAILAQCRLPSAPGQLDAAALEASGDQSRLHPPVLSLKVSASLARSAGSTRSQGADGSCPTITIRLLGKRAQSGDALVACGRRSRAQERTCGGRGSVSMPRNQLCGVVTRARADWVFSPKIRLELVQSSAIRRKPRAILSLAFVPQPARAVVAT